MITRNEQINLKNKTLREFYPIYGGSYTTTEFEQYLTALKTDAKSLFKDDTEIFAGIIYALAGLDGNTAQKFDSMEVRNILNKVDTLLDICLSYIGNNCEAFNLGNVNTNALTLCVKATIKAYAVSVPTNIVASNGFQNYVSSDNDVVELFDKVIAQYQGITANFIANMKQYFTGASENPFGLEVFLQVLSSSDIYNAILCQKDVDINKELEELFKLMETPRITTTLEKTSKVAHDEEPIIRAEEGSVIYQGTTLNEDRTEPEQDTTPKIQQNDNVIDVRPEEIKSVTNNSKANDNQSTTASANSTSDKNEAVNDKPFKFTLQNNDSDTVPPEVRYIYIAIGKALTEIIPDVNVVKQACDTLNSIYAKTKIEPESVVDIKKDMSDVDKLSAILQSYYCSTIVPILTGIHNGFENSINDIMSSNGDIIVAKWGTLAERLMPKFSKYKAADIERYYGLKVSSNYSGFKRSAKKVFQKYYKSISDWINITFSSKTSQASSDSYFDNTVIFDGESLEDEVFNSNVNYILKIAHDIDMHRNSVPSRFVITDVKSPKNFCMRRLYNDYNNNMYTNEVATVPDQKATFHVGLNDVGEAVFTLQTDSCGFGWADGYDRYLSKEDVAGATIYDFGICNAISLNDLPLEFPTYEQPDVAYSYANN